MKNFKNLLKTLLVGTFFAVVGNCLAGCDGSEMAGEDPTQDAGVGSDMDTRSDTISRLDTGARSDTGATPTFEPCNVINVVLVVPTEEHSKTVTPAAKALELCVGWTASRDYATAEACILDLSKTMTPSQAETECTTPMTLAECQDSEHGFVGRSGVKHAFSVSPLGYSRVLSGFGIAPDCKNGELPICTAKGKYGTYFGTTCFSF